MPHRIDSLQSLKTHILKARGIKKVFHANGNKKKVGVAIVRQNRL